MGVSGSRPVEQKLAPPYGAMEQYGNASPQGPFTDIYAIGVVVFTAMLAGERFPNAPDRLSRDPFVPMSQRLRGQEYSGEFLAAVDWALKLRAEQRPQSIHAWRQALNLTRRTSIVQKSQHSLARVLRLPRGPSLKIGSPFGKNIEPSSSFWPGLSS